MNSVLEAIAADARDGDGPRLISVDELRAAGALDVPESWRKSLGSEGDLFAGIEGTLPLFAATQDEAVDEPPSEAEPRR